MKVRIYQIDFERDEKFLCYRNLETVLERCGGIIPAESYNMVFEYEALSDNLERLFFIFNEAHPKGYKARSMSMSDVVEVIDPVNGSKFFFCDKIGFKEVSFDASKAKGGPQ
ncbi:MAG: hypothetical protein IJO56_03165 [Oscillospiraceae bacterium]|nr:hypothetical protein [Oscillospiraceae bacterium]